MMCVLWGVVMYVCVRVSGAGEQGLTSTQAGYKAMHMQCEPHVQSGHKASYSGIVSSPAVLFWSTAGDETNPGRTQGLIPRPGHNMVTVHGLRCGMSLHGRCLGP